MQRSAAQSGGILEKGVREVLLAQQDRGAHDGEAGASVSHFDIVFTFLPDQFTNPCTGTTDIFASELRVLSQATLAPSGIVTVEGLNDFRGQGDVLSFRQLTTFHISGDGSDNAPFIVNEVGSFLIHEPGAADNAYQKFALHLTINANGEVTSATQELGSVECRG